MSELADRIDNIAGRIRRGMAVGPADVPYLLAASLRLDATTDKPEAAEQFTVITRGLSRASQVDVRSYGPYPTRVEAKRVAQRIKVAFYADPDRGGETLGVHVTKILHADTAADAAAAEPGEYI